MTRERKRFSWLRVLVLLFLGLSGAMLCSNLLPMHRDGHVDPHLVTCMNNLRQLSMLKSERLDAERLQLLPGSAFLRQMATDLDDADLEVFLCPDDPRYPSLIGNRDDLVKRYRADLRTAPCSYRGPDADLLAEAR